MKKLSAVKGWVSEPVIMDDIKLTNINKSEIGLNKSGEMHDERFISRALTVKIYQAVLD